MNVICQDCHQPLHLHPCPGTHAETSPSETMPPGIAAALAERLRQLERFAPRKDDGYTDGELADAAGCYLELAGMQARGTFAETLPGPPLEWPWDPQWWHPSNNPQRNLEKGMALAAAEWDRLERANVKAAPLPTNPPRPVPRWIQPVPRWACTCPVRPEAPGEYGPQHVDTCEMHTDF